MTDEMKRNLLKAGAAAATMAAASQVMAAQQPSQSAAPGAAPPAGASPPAGAAPPLAAGPPPAPLPGTTKFYQKGNVRIAYQEHGRGFPLLLIAGGGLNSVMAGLPRSAFNPIAEFSDEYRCIYADLRNANPGQSTGPVEVDRPWDQFADDQLGLMDHLGIRRFMVLGFCIGGPFIWNLIKRAPDRVVAGVPAQPVGFRPEAPTVLYDSGMTVWGPEFVKRRPDVSMAMIEQYQTNMFSRSDFLFTVSRDFVRQCQTPVLVMPDDIPAHPYAVAWESAMLAPKAEITMFPWKEPAERIPLAVRQVRSFLKAHRPA